MILMGEFPWECVTPVECARLCGSFWTYSVQSVFHHSKNHTLGPRDASHTALFVVPKEALPKNRALCQKVKQGRFPG